MLLSREILSAGQTAIRKIIKKGMLSLPRVPQGTQKTPTDINVAQTVTGGRTLAKSTGRRAFSCISGSLTPEAALAVPLFLFAVYILWIFFSVMSVHLHLQAAAEEVTGQLAQQSFLLAEWQGSAGDSAGRGQMSGMAEGLSLSGMVSDSAWMLWAKDQLIRKTGRELLDRSPVVSGASGIRVLGSRWDQKGDLDLRIDYQVEIPVLLGIRWKMALTQHSLRRSWTGSQSRGSGDEADRVEMVYITPSGSVYHRDISCYHLLLTVREVPASSVGGQSSNSGGGYTPCERCADGVRATGKVYIAKEGDRYHTTRDCAGLKRSVTAVPITSAGGRRPCSNCGS